MSAAPHRRVLIRGAGELASGVAVHLHRHCYRLLLTEVAQPRCVRRLVCFAEAVHAGRATVEGVEAILRPLQTADFRHGPLPVVVDPEGSLIPRLAPDAVVDARLLKSAPGPLAGGPRPLIGLGPGFLAGRDADLVVETHRPAGPGRVIAEGGAAANTGIPGSVGGETARRVLRSPASGRLEAARRIGDLVQAGEELGRVAGTPLLAPIGGLLRGLIHPAVELSPGDKVGDIDPRGAAIDPARISDKAQAVAAGVLQALQRLGVDPGRRSDRTGQRR